MTRREGDAGAEAAAAEGAARTTESMRRVRDTPLATHERDVSIPIDIDLDEPREGEELDASELHELTPEPMPAAVRLGAAVAGAGPQAAASASTSHQTGPYRALPTPAIAEAPAAPALRPIDSSVAAFVPGASARRDQMPAAPLRERTPIAASVIAAALSSPTRYPSGEEPGEELGTDDIELMNEVHTAPLPLALNEALRREQGDLVRTVRPSAPPPPKPAEEAASAAPLAAPAAVFIASPAPVAPPMAAPAPVAAVIAQPSPVAAPNGPATGPLPAMTPPTGVALAAKVSVPPPAPLAAVAPPAALAPVVLPPSASPTPPGLPTMPSSAVAAAIESETRRVATPPAENDVAKRKRRVKQWFEEVFDEDYLRTLPFMTPRQTQKEAEFILSSLLPQPIPGGSPPSGPMSILDLGCGYGRHTLELAAKGHKMTGLDLSLPLLIRAADEAQRRQLQIDFIHGDMRELSFDARFDAAFCAFTTFGFFDDETNRRVTQSIARALKPGGRLLLDVVNRDYIVADLPTRIWWEGDGCVVLEEVDFNYFTSRLVSRRSIVFDDGRQVEQDISIRAYSLHELGKMLHHADFRVIEVSGALGTRGRFFGVASPQILILAERRSGT